MGYGGYDAANAWANTKRRRWTINNMRSEDKLLRPYDRDTLASSARNLGRNAPDFGWMIRKHLDYVSTFSFQCRSGITELDDKIEDLMDWWSRPQNCDIAYRHSLPKLIRLTEQCATIDGDCFVLKLKNGMIQLIESDRVRTPTNLGGYTNFKTSDFIHGVYADSAGKALSYAVCDRKDGGFILSSVMPAYQVLQHGYFVRNDQLRGVSPIASAINSFNDLYESREYALNKAKLSQLLGLKTKFEGDDEPDQTDSQGNPIAQTIDFNSGGVQRINLGPNDDVSFMETSTPSNEFQAFLLQGTQVALKALDIDYSFYDSSHTNYSGARQALLIYEQSCQDKRNRVIQLLNNLTAWRLGLFIDDGELELPAGITLDHIKWEWIPAALPWIDPQKEATANSMLIANRLSSHQQISKEQSRDWFTTIDQLLEEEKYELDRRTEMGLPQMQSSDTNTNSNTSNSTLIAQQIAEMVIEQMQGNK